MSKLRGKKSFPCDPVAVRPAVGKTPPWCYEKLRLSPVAVQAVEEEKIRSQVRTWVFSGNPLVTVRLLLMKPMVFPKLTRLV